jgi:hypothetical protein
MGLWVREEKSGLEDRAGNLLATDAGAGDRACGATALAEPAAVGPGRTIGRKLTQDLIVTSFGAATSLLTAVILFVLDQNFEVSFYTWSLDYVLPAGAILSGLAASAGYYLGARCFDYRPTWRILVSIVAVSVGTFFLVHWLTFRFLQVAGRPLSEQISFFAYLDWLFRHQSLRPLAESGGRAVTTGALGLWGYLFAGLQVAGFALGGVCVFLRLAAIPYCEKCSRYFGAGSKQERLTSDPHRFAALLKEVAAAFDAGRLSEAIGRHTRSEEPTPTRKCRFKSTLDLCRCSGCGTYRLGFCAHERFGNGWKRIKGAKLAGLHEEPLYLPQ